MNKSIISNAAGALVNTIRYAPFGATRSITGIIATDKKFTGQILDDTGLYYYNARYYDPLIGRFISADTVIPNSANPQCFNRYSYCLNNPLRYTDPSGNDMKDSNGNNMNGVDSDNIELYVFSNQEIGRDVDINDTVSYVVFKDENPNIADALEKSDLIYTAQSKTTSVDDLYITNSQYVNTFVNLITGPQIKVDISTHFQWHQGKTTITVSVTSGQPAGVKVGAKIDVNGDRLILDKEPGYSFGNPTSRTDYGSRTINGFPQSPLTVNVSMYNFITAHFNRYDYSIIYKMSHDKYHIPISPGYNVPTSITKK